MLYLHRYMYAFTRLPVHASHNWWCAITNMHQTFHCSVLSIMIWLIFGVDKLHGEHWIVPTLHHGLLGIPYRPPRITRGWFSIPWGPHGIFHGVQASIAWFVFSYVSSHVIGWNSMHHHRPVRLPLIRVLISHKAHLVSTFKLYL